MNETVTETEKWMKIKNSIFRRKKIPRKKKNESDPLLSVSEHEHTLDSSLDKLCSKTENGAKGRGSGFRSQICYGISLYTHKHSHFISLALSLSYTHSINPSLTFFLSLSFLASCTQSDMSWRSWEQNRSGHRSLWAGERVCVSKWSRKKDESVRVAMLLSVVHAISLSREHTRTLTLCICH